MIDLTFTKRTNPRGDALHAIAWNGSVFCAVGDALGTEIPPYCATSPDGVAWTERTIPRVGNFSHLRSIAWNGSIFCAVGGWRDGAGYCDAHIETSPDGITWTEQSHPSNMVLFGIAWGDSQFIAVGMGYTGSTYSSAIITSPDGITWTVRTAPTMLNLYKTLDGIVWAGSFWCAVGVRDGAWDDPDAEGDALILTSTDGTTWTERANPTNLTLESVAWNGTQLCAVGLAYSTSTDAYIITSPDGVTWTQQTPSGNKGSLYGIIWADYFFCAFGSEAWISEGWDATIITSYDGVVWEEQVNPSWSTLVSAAYDNTGRILCIVGGPSDDDDAYIITSPVQIEGPILEHVTVFDTISAQIYGDDVNTAAVFSLSDVFSAGAMSGSISESISVSDLITFELFTVTKLAPSAGVWLDTDATPLSATLTTKACLIDADVTSDCTGVVDSAMSVGVDLGSTKTVSKLILRLLSSEITFPTTWGAKDSLAVYSSADNSTWTLEQTFNAPTLVADGDYIGHVELVLTAPVSARYFKVYASDGGLE